MFFFCYHAGVINCRKCIEPQNTKYIYFILQFNSFLRELNQTRMLFLELNEIWIDVIALKLNCIDEQDGICSIMTLDLLNVKFQFEYQIISNECSQRCETIKNCQI